MKGVRPGRIVNYQLAKEIVRPLLVVSVLPSNALDAPHLRDKVNGVVFGAGGADMDTLGTSNAYPMVFKQHVAYDHDKKPGTWHWPEKK